MSCEQHEADLRELQRQREVLAEALDAMLTEHCPSHRDGECPDPIHMAARAALRSIGKQS